LGGRVRRSLRVRRHAGGADRLGHAVAARIAKRKVAVDWFRAYPDAGDWKEGPQGQSPIKPGGRYPEDDSYSFLDPGGASPV